MKAYYKGLILVLNYLTQAFRNGLAAKHVIVPRVLGVNRKLGKLES